MCAVVMNASEPHDGIHEMEGLLREVEVMALGRFGQRRVISR